MGDIKITLARWGAWVRQCGMGQLGYGSGMASIVAMGGSQSVGEYSPLDDDFAMVVSAGMNRLNKHDRICYQSVELYYAYQLTIQQVGNEVYKKHGLSARTRRNKASDDIKTAERILECLISEINDGLKKVA